MNIYPVVQPTMQTSKYRPSGNEQHLIEQVLKIAEESLLVFPTGCSAMTRQTEAGEKLQVSGRRNRQSAFTFGFY